MNEFRTSKEKRKLRIAGIQIWLFFHRCLEDHSKVLECKAQVQSGQSVQESLFCSLKLQIL